jgi:hypothetical protein
MPERATVSVETLNILLARALRTNNAFGQCIDCETANEDPHSTDCATARAILEAKFALFDAAFRAAAVRTNGRKV